MNDPVVKLPCTIETLSPVHIGVGERLTWMSMTAKGDHLYVVDERRLLARVTQTPQALARFMSYTDNPNSQIGQYLRDEHIDPGEVAAYSVPIVGARPGREILPFIKNPGQSSLPYIPGSSLKGAVRTALLQAAMVEDETFLRRADKAVRQQLHDDGGSKYADDRLEQALFGCDQHRDWMRALQFADTEGVSADSLAVVEVQTLSVRNAALSPKTFTIHPETLVPGKGRLRGSVTINVSLITPGPAQTIMDVRSANQRVTGFVQGCNRAASMLIKRELAFYQNYHSQDLQAWYEDLETHRKSLEDGACLLWLGWGSGYESQATGSLFDRELQETLRLEYELGKIIHQGCGGRVRRSRRPKGRKRWYCRKCKADLVNDSDVRLVWPFAKSRKVAMTDKGRMPLGWIKLRI